MPYDIKRDSEGHYCVVKAGTRKVFGRHPSKARARAQMRALYASEGKSMDPIDDGTLVYYGEAVKALDDAGRIGGHLVLWGDEDTPDATATKDYFEADTDFWEEFPTRKPLIYHHGLDPTIKARRLGMADLSVDDAGVWMEAQLKLRDEYERHIFEAVKQGKMGLSSGSAGHLVRRERRPTGAHKLLSWPLVEASITPTPGEPRTLALALKTLMTDHPESEDAPDSIRETLHATASALERALGFEKFGDAKWDALQTVKAALTAVERKFPRVNPAELSAALSRIDELKARLRA